MEVSILPNENYPISAILAKDFVEARLHTDGKTNTERILELQENLARSVANPIYVIVDPRTEREVGRYEGAALKEPRIGEFVDFLLGSTDVAALDR